MKIQCNITEIILSSMDLPGYIFKFELAAGKKENLGSRKHLPCTFQFKYDLARQLIVGEYTDNLVEDLVSDNEYDASNAQILSTI